MCPHNYNIGGIKMKGALQWCVNGPRGGILSFDQRNESPSHNKLNDHCEINGSEVKIADNLCYEENEHKF